MPNSIQELARQALKAQGVDDPFYFALLTKLAAAIGCGMFETSRRLAQLAGE